MATCGGTSAATAVCLDGSTTSRCVGTRVSIEAAAFVAPSFPEHRVIKKSRHGCSQSLPIKRLRLERSDAAKVRALCVQRCTPDATLGANVHSKRPGSSLENQQEMPEKTGGARPGKRLGVNFALWETVEWRNCPHHTHTHDAAPNTTGCSHHCVTPRCSSCTGMSQRHQH